MTEKQKQKRGRPTYKPTAKARHDVEMFLACGMTHDQISAALKIDSDTFKKHFASEIDTGRGRARARILAMLLKSAKAGNVSAQKKLEEMSRLADASAEIEAATATPAAREPNAGKKKQAEAEAAATVNTPAGDWGDDLNPHSVN